MGTAASTVSSASATPTSTKRATEEATVLEAVRASFWPMERPSSTVLPIARPVTTPVMVCMVMLPVETAETAAASLKRPTTIRSTVPYIACSRFAPMIGSAKNSSLRHTGPLVRSCSIPIPS